MTPNSTIAQYRIVSKIGEGGMGVVYLAHDAGLGRRVAIKALPDSLAKDAHMRERLRREAMSAAALDHPFICKVFEIGEHDGTLFIVMEYIPGQTLYAKMRSGPMPVNEVIRVASQVADALELAHRQGFLHRDLKPANIMLTEQGYVKVMDFGLAKRATEQISGEDITLLDQPSLTERGAVMGTPEYMSPEQLKAQVLDARSDLFSFGIILAEMLSGKHPFRKASTAETIAAVLEKQPDLSGDIPQGLMLLIRRLLAKSAEERYASISEVRSDLGRVAAGAALGEPEKPVAGRIPLIGRDAERQQLLRHLDEALVARGSLILIGGEPGIGKTHLITAVLEEARRRGAFANIGHCYEMEGSPPYVPFIEMLEYSARVAPRETFRHTLGDAAPEVAKLMPELRLMYSDIPPALELPPEQQRRFLFNAYREFVQRAAAITPIAVVFEDLQWADEPTLLLLQHLAQVVATSPILMIGTYRDAGLDVTRPFAKTLENLVRQKLATRMSLRRLPVSGVEQMLAAMSGQKPPLSLARVVLDETDGNPFFVEEVFRHLSEEGKLFDSDGRFRAGLRSDRLQVPEGVRLVLRRRLERLGEEARRILTTAAVIGRVFSLPLLEELEKERPDAALEAMEEAEAAYLVVAQPAGRETRFKFVHELVRQTLAETLSLPRRQRLHARVADVMERVYAASLDSHVSALAHHLYQAGAAADPDKTAQYLIKAAQYASMAAAHEEALTHLDDALSILGVENSVRVGDLHAHRAAVLRSLLRENDAIQAYERALDVFDANGDDTRFVQTSFPLAGIYAWALRFQEMAAVVGRVKARTRNAPPDLRCLVLAQQAIGMSSAGEIDMALELIAERLRIPQSELSLRTKGIAWTFEALSHLHAAQWDLTEECALRAQAILEQLADGWYQTELDHAFAISLVYRGRLEEGEQRLLESIPRAVRVGHKHAHWSALVWLGVTRFAKGDLDDGMQLLREGMALAESIGGGWVFGSYSTLGYCLMLCDRFEESLPLLRLATQAPPTSWCGYAEGSLALAMARQGDPGAVAALREAARFLPRPGCGRSLGSWGALVTLLQGFCFAGLREEAGAWQAQTERIAQETEYAGPMFPLRTAAGIAAACARNWDRAEEHHRSAIQRVDASPGRTLQPIARYWYADMLLERGGAGDFESARELLENAMGMSEQIGLALYVRLAREKLSGIA